MLRNEDNHRLAGKGRSSVLQIELQEPWKQPEGGRYFLQDLLCHKCARRLFSVENTRLQFMFKHSKDKGEGDEVLFDEDVIFFVIERCKNNKEGLTSNEKLLFVTNR